MSKKAKQYSPQEKAKVAMEAIKGDLTMAQISSKYGVHATQINRWKRGGVEAMVLGFSTRPKAEDTSKIELVNQLYQQIGQLTVERDWLKKKSATFVFGI
jgi:transposase